MKTLGNVIWFILIGLWQGLLWAIIGALFCITIIGIPLGKQCFKMMELSFFPFGKEVIYGGGAPSFIANLIWIIFAGMPMAIANVSAGVLLCVTIVLIPFGLQCFKFAKLSFMPFGASLR